MKHYIILCIMSFCHTISTSAQHPLDTILDTIEANNPQLLALRKSHLATMAEKKSENTLGETSVEYTPFFQRGTNGIASSELIVSQEFDFPTVYASRRKSADLQQQVLDQEYLVLRNDLLLQACCLCYDLATAYQNASLLRRRLAAADTLLMLTDRRLSNGDATVMESNRVKMDRMTILTEQVQNQGEIDKTRLALIALGASESQLTHIASFGDLSSLGTLAHRQMGQGSVSLSEASVQSARHDLRLTRQSWLPKLTLGYRRNTELREHFNGPLVGISMPLFSNSQKVRAARLRQSASEQQLEAARLATDARQRALDSEVANLQSLLAAYDQPLLFKTLADLMRAVQAGQLSVMDYYAEADRVYSSLQSRLQTENTYYKTIAELSTY